MATSQPNSLTTNADISALVNDYNTLISTHVLDTNMQLSLAADILEDAVTDIEHSFLALVGDRPDNDPHELATAVRALQFEDLVRQLLERVREQADQLSQLSADLVEIAEPGKDNDAPLARLCEHIARTRERHAAEHHQVVTQSSMAPGEIELF